VSQLRIDLLGSLNVWCDGQPTLAPAWPSRKTCQLFKILITHRQRAVSSDEIIEWLWPHLTPESGRNSLWVAVSRLRRLLEPEIADRGSSTFILTEPPGYRFDPAGRCELDVEAYLSHVATGQDCQRRGDGPAAIEAYLAAEALYRGDYLAQDPYEDWAIPARERLRETFLEMKVSLAACHLALGRYQEALDHFCG
jgi:LuxR family maltose regulon positive regulatory protein